MENTPMKSNKIIISLFSAITLFSNVSLGQKSGEKIQTFHDGLNASTVIKKQTDFNLKGNVKQVIEVSSLKQDSTILQFNNKGILEQETNGETKRMTRYTFAFERLQTIYFEDHFSKSEKYFNSFGLLIKEVYDNKNTTDTFHREALYTYNTDKYDLQISYSYNMDTSRYDLVLFDFYKFIFNSKQQIIEEQQQSKRTGPPQILVGYSFTSTKYDYELISGLLKIVTHKEGCYPSNSCGLTFYSINYDTRGNIISQSLSDQTIRNSNWSSSYGWSAKYNENNDIVEEYYVDDSNRPVFHIDWSTGSKRNKKKQKRK
jgi:hypothetical protein